jgi:hypothetical protein
MDVRADSGVLGQNQYNPRRLACCRLKEVLSSLASSWVLIVLYQKIV